MFGARLNARADVGAIALAAALSCVSGAVIVFASRAFANDKTALVGAFALCAVCALGPVLLFGRGAAREPVVYYPVLAFADLAGSSLLWLGEPRSVVALSRTDITMALLLVSAGFSVFWLAWYASRGRRAARLRSSLPDALLPSREATLALAVAGVACILLRVATGSYGYTRDFDTGGPLGPWTEWVTAGGVALDVALAFAAFRAFGATDRTRARADLTVLIMLVVVIFGFGLLAGFKVGVTLPKLLVVVFIYAQFQGRAPFKFIVASVVMLLLAAPVVQRFRDLSEHNLYGQGPIGLLASSVEATAQDASASFPDAIETLGGRVRQIENVAVVVRDTPSVLPYTNGVEIPDAVAAAVVPRVVWPDKPIRAAHREFPQLYLRQPVTTRSSTGPSHFGDLYRNSGFAGVAIGMGLLSAIFARLGRTAQRGGLRTVLIVAFIVSVLTRVESSVGETIVAFARVMPPVLLAALLLPRVSSSGARNAAARDCPR